MFTVFSSHTKFCFRFFKSMHINVINGNKSKDLVLLKVNVNGLDLPGFKIQSDRMNGMSYEQMH